MTFDFNDLLKPMALITLKVPVDEADRIAAALTEAGAKDAQLCTMKRLDIGLLTGGDGNHRAAARRQLRALPKGQADAAPRSLWSKGACSVGTGRPVKPIT